MSKIILFKESNFGGTALTLNDSDRNLKREGFGDVISSVIVIAGEWRMFQHQDFAGNSWTVTERGGPDKDGAYPSPESWSGQHDVISSIEKIK
jgi:hypothetical protein